MSGLGRCSKRAGWRGRRVRVFMRALLATTSLSIVGPTVAMAQTAPAVSATRTYNIPSQSLDGALATFSRIADVQVLNRGATTQGVTSPGINGRFTPQEAVSRLLAGTGLTPRFVGTGTVTLERPNSVAAGGAATVPGAIPLDTIDVQGANPNSTMTPPPEYAGGQVATGGQLGLLGNRGIMDTPFNQTSYTAKKAQNQQAKTIRDVLADDPSVRAFIPDGGAGSDQMYIRGFSVWNSNAAYGGLYGMLPSISIMPELAERIEVLKGPSVMLNGMPPATSVGGSINVVPKRAPAEPLAQITANYGSAGQVGGHVDVARRFGDQQQFGVRFNGVYKDGKTDVQWNTDERALAVLGLDYRGDRVRLAADVGYQYQHVNGMIPYLGFDNNVPILSAPNARKNVGQPWNYTDYKDAFGVVRGEVDLTDHITAWAAFGAHDNRGQQLNAGTRVIVGDVFGNASSRPLVYNNYAINQTAQVGLRAQADTGPISHELAVTATTYHQEAGEGATSLAFVNTNIYNPIVIPRPSVAIPAALKTSTQGLSSFGLADTLSMADKRIQLTIGGRFQQVEAANFNPTTGAQTSSYDEHAFSPSVALVIKPWENVSLYANWIQGLQQGTIVGPSYANSGEVFPPYKTTQYEAGVKVDWGKFTSTVSLFQISQPSILTDVAANTLVLAGEQRNRGLEINVFGEVREGVRVLGGAMFLEPVLTKTEDGLADGWTAPFSPRFTLNLGGEWDLPFIPGLTLTGRAVYTGAQYIDTSLPRRQLSDWTRYDIGARYTFENPTIKGKLITARLNIDNVLDANYWAGGNGPTNLMMGAPRTYRLSLTTEF